MKNNFLVRCKYIGSTIYTKKDDTSIIIHSFEDSLGNVFTSRLDDFDGNIGDSYLLNLFVGDTNKDGNYKQYYRFKLATIN